MNVASSYSAKVQSVAGFVDFHEGSGLPWFVVKVRPLCTRGSLKAVEAGKPHRALMVRQVWAGSGLCSRSARNSSRFVLRASSVSLQTSVLASRYSVRFSVTALRRLFRRLMVQVVLRPGRLGGPSLGVLALSVALVPSGRRLSGSPRRGCNLDPEVVVTLKKKSSYATAEYHRKRWG